MKASQTVIYWFTVFALCFVSYQQISDHIRPHYSGHNSVIQYLLGIAPNFFSAIGIPALFVILLPEIKRNSPWLQKNKPLIANLISLAGLLTWECIQTTSKKLYFDWNDVLWTIIGALVFQLIWTLTPNRYKG